MKLILTLSLFNLLTYFGFSQTGSGTLNAPEICTNGCNINCPLCSSSPTTGDCANYVSTRSVEVLAGHAISISISNANCGSFGSFDGDYDRIIFNDGTQTLVQAQAATRCFVNSTSGNITVTFGYRANRKDEFVSYEYSINSGTQCQILPVSFSLMHIKNEESGIAISFSTASETNNDYFTIERSGDGSSFDAIGMIDGAGNSSEERHYEFTDENPLPGINYYRIKQTDYDGQYSYSEIRSVRHDGAGKIAISPRHTDGRLDITTEIEHYDVAVYSSTGQEVSRFVGLSGHQSVSIESLQSGIYFVKVVSGSVSETVKVVKY